MSILNERTILRSFSVPSSLDERLNAAAFQTQRDQSELLLSFLRDGLDQWETRRNSWTETERLIEDALRGEDAASARRWSVDPTRWREIGRVLRKHLGLSEPDDNHPVAMLPGESGRD